MNKKDFISNLNSYWTNSPRWSGIKRPYTAEDVWNIRGSFPLDFSLAQATSEKLWHLLQTQPFVRALGSMTGGQAVQCAKGGLKALYLSGWQTAADANESGEVYPDQSLYPVNSVPQLAKRLNKALQRADQVEWSETNGSPTTDYLLPIVADAEAGFGGNLNAFELMKGMIESGVAGVHFEDQLSSAKKCGHMGGKVLVPGSEFVSKLVAARLAADVCGVPTILVARTDANGAKLLTSDVDEVDWKFIKGGDKFSSLSEMMEYRYENRTPEGFYSISGGIDMAISRGLLYAPYADLIWCETSTPDMQEAKKFAEAIHKVYPEKMLAYNCSPSFNWKKHLSEQEIATFQEDLANLGYKYQFITLAGFHALNKSMFDLAASYNVSGMSAYSKLQQEEFGIESQGYTATKHQREVGAKYFDKIATIITSGETSTLAIKGSTEEEQF